MKSARPMQTLFDEVPEVVRRVDPLADGAVILRGFALDFDQAVKSGLDQIVAAAPFRHMTTPGGFRMSVAMTNCGGYGWVSDRRGYRYDSADPETSNAWPPMPPAFLDLAVKAASTAGYPHFVPDACLVNRYEPGARLTLHQDKNERDFAEPIVSVSLGLPATFLFGGSERTTKAMRARVFHGDVVVWGGPSRLAYHGVSPLAEGEHPFMGRHRINLTFRRAR